MSSAHCCAMTLDHISGTITQRHWCVTMTSENISAKMIYLHEGVLNRHFEILKYVVNFTQQAIRTIDKFMCIDIQLL
jgi:hypothetical protein